MKREVVERARARWGLAASVEDVDVSLGAVRLENVTVGTEDGRGLRVAVGAIVVRGSLWSLGLRGPRAAEELELLGVAAKVDLASPELAKLMEVAAEGDSSKNPGGAVAQQRVRIRDFEADVRDGDAQLLAVHRGDLEGDRSRLQGMAAKVRVAQPSLGWTGELTGISGTIARREGWKLERLSVESSAWSWVSRGPEKSDAPSVDDTEDADRADPGASGFAGVASANSLALETKDVGAVERLLSFLMEGTELRFDAMSVTDARTGAARQVLGGAQAHVRVEAEHALAVSAHGQAEGSGRLDVELRLWPKQLRADGRVQLQELPLTLVAPLLPEVAWDEPENGRIDADLTVRTESFDRLRLEGRAELRDAAVSSPRLASSVVRGIGFTLSGNGFFYPLRRRLEIEQGEIRVGKAMAQVSGSLEHSPEHYAVDVSLSLPPTPCTDAVMAVPEGLLGDLALARWTGTIGGRLRFAADSERLDETVLDFGIQDRCEFVSVPAMADLRRFSGPFVHSVVEPDDSVFEMETGPGTEAWTPIGAISPFLLHAVLTHEDPGFFEHRGFSPLHIRNALARNLRERRYAVGASTITMQLVKNIFLHREKTLARKLQEVLLTWWIERVLPKPQILELYLNVIEYGPSVYGIRHAARHYFNRLPADLSPAESVFFATILPSPKRYHSYFERGALTPSWMNTMRKLMARLGERGAYSPEAVAYGMQEIERFKFVPEGTAAPVRVLSFATRELPLSTGMSPFDDDGDFDDGVDDDGIDDDLGDDFGREPLRAD